MPRLIRALHVAEKPSVAKKVAEHLSKGVACNNRQGPSVYNRLFDFETGGPPSHGACRVRHVVTSVTGHLMSTEFEEPHNKWHAGEAIAFEVVDVCRRIKPNVDLWRAKFSSVDEKEILKAWRSLGRPDKRKADAVAARCELDLRSGAAFTRFQTFRVQGKYAGVAEEGVVSYGPCQFPTLGFIVARQQEIDAHDARDFWRASIWRRAGVLEKVEAKPAAKRRPLPLSTLELQKRASRWLKLGSAETMEVAEALYQRGYVSYPRTETELFRDTCDVRELVDRQRPDGRFGTFAAQLLDLPPDDRRAFLWPRQGAKDDEAHPPIHPTKAVAANELQGKEAKVFELIARHFLACCARDARGRQTNATAQLGGERFDARGLMVDERNYLDVYPYESWSTATLPPFFAGDALPRPSALNLARSRTQPPRGLTEADLLSKMDAHGIGTDATMADHIKTVLTRDYALRDNAPPHVFRPTPLGSALVEAYDAMGMRLNLPQLRAALEADVALVASGAKSKDAVLADCLRTMRDSFDAVSRDVAKLDDAMRRRPAAAAAAAPPRRPRAADYAPRGRACDACGFGTVDERHPESGRVFPRCPKCYERHPAPAAPSRRAPLREAAAPVDDAVGPQTRVVHQGLRRGRLAPVLRPQGRGPRARPRCSAARAP
ncbi:DNA topoisomerase type I [Aureococcus anophagefferens]|nr:DNA topoisomerase type I [Aureococcus anophagefferens]